MRVRIELRREASDADAAISGWANHIPGANGLSVFRLDYEYPGWKPAPGWSLSCDLGVFAVVAADGKILTASNLTPDTQTPTEAT